MSMEDTPLYAALLNGQRTYQGKVMLFNCFQEVYNLAWQHGHETGWDQAEALPLPASSEQIHNELLQDRHLEEEF